MSNNNPPHTILSRNEGMKREAILNPVTITSFSQTIYLHTTTMHRSWELFNSS